MYRHLLSPLMAFAVSNSISLFCLAIVILSFTAQYIPSLYLTNMCNTICLIFLTAFIATRASQPSPATRASDVPHIPSPSPSTRTPPSPPTTHHFPFYPDVQDTNSFLDLSSEESSQDSGLGLSISSLEDMPSEGEAGDVSQLTRPPKVGTKSASTFRDQPTPSLSSEPSFRLSVLDAPEQGYDEDEEYVTLGMMTLQRGATRRWSGDSYEDPIMVLADRFSKLNLGSVPSQPSVRTKKLQLRARETKPPTRASSITNKPFSVISVARVAPKLANCCRLANHTFTPHSWEDHDFCYDCSTFQRFIRPMDEDSFFRSTRLAVDNLMHFRSNRYLLPNQPVDRDTLSGVFKPFGSTVERCFLSRLHDDVIVYESAFGVVDFSSEEEAHAAFHALQGRRIRGEKAHWRLEFLDPEDMTFGERLPIIRSTPPLGLIRALDRATAEPERIDDTLRPPSSLASAQAPETPAKRKKHQCGRLELHRPTIKPDERGGSGAIPISAVKLNTKL